MKYMGSKSRIVKSIAPIIQSYVDKRSGIYYLGVNIQPGKDRHGAQHKQPTGS